MFVDQFQSKYEELDKLGDGPFSSVYAALRRSDHLPVAIKHIPKVDVDYCSMFLNGAKLSIPEEVLMMVRAGGGPETLGQHAAVSLIDWYDLTEEVLLVMERPLPVVDLYTYLEDNDGPLTERKAKNILKQLVQAVNDIHSRGVFHRDLKIENILIQTLPNGIRVRIVDFGCGCLASSGPFEEFSGTSAFAPPEFVKKGTYSAGPTSVWQLGAILFELVDGHTQFSTSEFVAGKLKYRKSLSKECLDFLRSCLRLDPQQRVPLERMAQHHWF